jgi:hypothetical protein
LLLQPDCRRLINFSLQDIAGHGWNLKAASCCIRKRQFLSFNIGIKSFLVVSADTPDHGIPLKKFEYRGANGKPRLTGFD